MLIFLVLLVAMCLNLTTNNINYNTDYFFALINISMFLIFMFFSNNLLAFIFVLELNSISIFYKFVTSKYWYKSKQTIEDQTFEMTNRAIPKNYLNMLFFQY
jgi:c-di-AMP phosphodiesterase-like protein